MKQIVFFLLIFAISFILGGCSSETSNANNGNVPDANTAEAPSPSANSNESPVAERSANQSNLPEANFPQFVEEIHRRVNEFRQSQGLQPLKLNPIISEQARRHSEEMSKTPDTISHENFDKRITELKKQLPFKVVGENVAANLNYLTPAEQAFEGWKNSPKHRENMLGDFNQTGIGVAKAGNGSYFFTQIFWKP